MTDRIVPVLLAATLTLVSPASCGETYRWVDDQGNVTYSDRAPQPRETGATTPEAKPAPDVRAPEVKVPEPKTVKNRIHWDVDVDDVQRLLDHGATLLREPDDDISWHVLTDPEGNEFCAFMPRK